MSGSNSSPPADARPDHPLDLTVHSLPSPDGVAQEDARRTVVGRWNMLAVLLVCAAPVIASYFTYYVVRPEGRRNFGELIEPQRPVPALSDAMVWRVDAAQLAQWLQPAAGQTLAGHLYVVDPMGNFMMRFPAGLDREGAASAKRDLERLMRASASWDQAGRP